VSHRKRESPRPTELQKRVEEFRIPHNAKEEETDRATPFLKNRGTARSGRGGNLEKRKGKGSEFELTRRMGRRGEETGLGNTKSSSSGQAFGPGKRGTTSGGRRTGARLHGEYDVELRNCRPSNWRAGRQGRGLIVKGKTSKKR